MVSKKEKILLDYMYRLGESLRDFIENNGYTSHDFRHVTVHYSKEYDYLEAGFAEFHENGSTKRIVKKNSVGTYAPEYEERTYGEGCI